MKLGNLMGALSLPLFLPFFFFNMKNELDEKKEKKKGKRKNVVVRLGPIPNESSQTKQALS